MFIYLMQAKVFGGFVVVSHPQAPKVMFFFAQTLEKAMISDTSGVVWTFEVNQHKCPFQTRW